MWFSVQKKMTKIIQNIWIAQNLKPGLALYTQWTRTGNGGILPLTHFGTRWMCVVIFMTRPINPPGVRSPGTQYMARWAALNIWEKRKMTLPGFEPQIVDTAAQLVYPLSYSDCSFDRLSNKNLTLARAVRCRRAFLFSAWSNYTPLPPRKILSSHGGADEGCFVASSGE